jgi:hypothetical protein
MVKENLKIKHHGSPVATNGAIFQASLFLQADLGNI